MRKAFKPWIFDTESYANFWCCTFLSLKDDEFKVFVIDDERNDAEEMTRFIQSGLYLIGYNSKSYDNFVINFIMRHPESTAQDIFQFQTAIINAQNGDLGLFHRQFGIYANNNSYKYIDLMRMLFSKKLRVSLKELECSLNFKNVEELPYPIGATLDAEQKRRVIEYNFNDCEATKEVAKKSLDAIKLRKWTQHHFGVDGFSLDGVNLGVKILERKLSEKLGNSDFTKKNTNRKFVAVKSVIYPFIKFETKEFNEVLKYFQGLKCFKYFDKEQNKEKWNKVSKDFLIGPYLYKYGIGGLHFGTLNKSWISNDEYEVLSVDVASYYPSQIEEYPESCIPEHLPKKEFKEVYVDIKTERLKAKAEGDDIKNDTYKLSINGAFGNLANEYSWLCDQKALMSITINGQLMLSMLCERLWLNNIIIIDANTDGIYLYLHKSQKEKFKEICSWWQELTRMVLEETRFESMYFLTTADYFGTYYKKGKLDVKEKGCFITKPRLGKGMEFPIIYEAVKEYFLNKKDFSTHIKECNDILKFCSYKKLKKAYTCYWKGEKQQKVNRFYASRAGAHLYKKKWSEKRQKTETSHILKDSPVILLNKLDNKAISERNINYPFYLSAARAIVISFEGDKGQQSLF